MPELNPLCVGPKNCEAMIGHSWRWLRDHAAELGLELIKIDGKSVVLASDLLAAIERRARAVVNAPPDVDSDEVAAMRRRVSRAL